MKILSKYEYGYIWVYYPFLLLAIMAVGLYYGATYLLKQNNPAKSEEVSSQDIDLDAEDSLATIMAKHNEATGGIRTLEYLFNADEIIYSGLLQTESQRYLFKSTVIPMESVSVHFISENHTFNFKSRPRLVPTTNFTPSPTRMNTLSELAMAIAELTGYAINPLHCASINSENFNVQNLRRTHRSGTPAIALDISFSVDEPFQATLYINENDMRTFAVDTNFGTGQLRSYHFKYSSNSSLESYPETIQVSSPRGQNWEFYFSQAQANYVSQE